jgi:hypothetical protein
MAASQPFAHDLPSGCRSVPVVSGDDSKTRARSLMQFALRVVSRYIQRTFLKPFADGEIDYRGN